MGLADIVAAQKPTPLPRATRLANEKVILEAAVSAAYTALQTAAAYVGPGVMDGDILVYETQPDLGTELREWIAAAGVKCALAWEGKTPVLNVSVLLAPDPVPEPAPAPEPAPVEPTP